MSQFSTTAISAAIFLCLSSCLSLASAWQLPSIDTPSAAPSLSEVQAPSGVQASSPVQTPSGTQTVATATKDDLENLIAKLTHHDFDERNAAAEKILLYRDEAIPVLEAQRHSNDSELKLQALRLLQIIERDSMERRLQRFIDDPQTSLPGWEIFQQVAGSSDAHRVAFSKIYRLYPEAMNAVVGQAKERHQHLNLLLTEHHQRLMEQQSDSIATTSAIILLFTTFFHDQTERDETEHVKNEHAKSETVPPVPSEANSYQAQTTPAGQRQPLLSLDVQRNVSKIFLNQTLKNCSQSQPYHDLLARSLEQWITYPDQDTALLPLRLQVAKHHGMAAGLIPAVQCLASNEMPSQICALAIEVVATQGDQSHVEALEKRLDDKTVLRATRRPPFGVVQTELGDLALATLIKLTKQNYSDFGFQFADQEDSNLFLNYLDAGFASEEARQKSRERWKEYREAH